MITRKQNRKGMLALTATLALAALSLTGAASAQEITTTVDGETVNFPDLQTTMINGRVMVPLRGVFEFMHASVDWDAATRTVIAQRFNDTIRLPINSYTATVNGRDVAIDAPARIQSGRTLVPLRFLSESLGANVDWIAATRTVEINTTDNYVVGEPWSKNLTANSSDQHQVQASYNTTRIDKGTVIPFTLNEKLSSNKSKRGDRFTANLDTDGDSDYQGMTEGAILEGHVDVAQAKSGKTPGVLGLAFDRVRMPNGQTYKVYGTLIGLDSKSVTNDNGRLTAKAGAKTNNLKWVGYGAGGGALLSVLTKSNFLTTTLIGGALGFLYGEIQKDPSKSNDVTSKAGTKFGVKLTRNLSFPAASKDKR
jgi:hypothetical protein